LLFLTREVCEFAKAQGVREADALKKVVEVNAIEFVKMGLRFIRRYNFACRRRPDELIHRKRSTRKVSTFCKKHGERGE
jgi:hypothetical protein